MWHILKDCLGDMYKCVCVHACMHECACVFIISYLMQPEEIDFQNLEHDFY